MSTSNPTRLFRWIRYQHGCLRVRGTCTPQLHLGVPSYILQCSFYWVWHFWRSRHLHELMVWEPPLYNLVKFQHPISFHIESEMIERPEHSERMWTLYYPTTPVDFLGWPRRTSQTRDTKHVIFWERKTWMTPLTISQSKFLIWGWGLGFSRAGCFFGS